LVKLGAEYKGEIWYLYWQITKIII
jgi:hypothetical protein